MHGVETKPEFYVWPCSCACGGTKAMLRCCTANPTPLDGPIPPPADVRRSAIYSTSGITSMAMPEHPTIVAPPASSDQACLALHVANMKDVAAQQPEVPLSFFEWFD